MLSGKSIAIKAYFNKLEKSEMNNLIGQLKGLGKKKRTI